MPRPFRLRRVLYVWVLLAAGFTLPPASAQTTFGKSLGPAVASSDASKVIAADDNPSRDGLFGDDRKAQDYPTKQESRDALFDTDSAMAPANAEARSPWRGFVRGELAYTYGSPAHWSKLLVRSELDAQGALTPAIKYKIGARLDYDFAYDATDFYPSEVRRDQRFNLALRENYIDTGAGDWDFRLGRQQIVWGEMVGLFFADVVSAKDLREFILPDFDVLRIPQWAARAEYSKGDFHAEAIWIPAPSFDEIGKPGAEFFPAVLPAPPGYATLYDNEQFPRRSARNSNYGLRLSMLKSGWDVSGFYYRSMDIQPTFYREVVVLPEPAVLYQARHDHIDQIGGTVAKDLGATVFKTEAVYTRGRSFGVLRSDDDGVVRQNTLDVAGGLDFSLPSDTRLNVQLFGRVFFDHDPDIIYKDVETGFSLLLNSRIADRWEAEILWITSLNRTDSLVRPRLRWNAQKNLSIVFGLDIFDGPPLGFFGQYANRDRIYTEARYSF